MPKSYLPSKHFGASHAILFASIIYHHSLFCDAFLATHNPRHQLSKQKEVSFFTLNFSGQNNNDCDYFHQGEPSRREFVSAALLGLGFLGGGNNNQVKAAEEAVQVSEEELQSLYDNPNIPPAPEERSGLVVLRVAEVAQFQEKILRAVASGELADVKVAPMQFTFGTQILLKNSDLDANMKLMIYNEVPRRQRDNAIKNAVICMNELQDIITYTSAIQRDFETQEMIHLADMYSSVRVNLNQLYEYLPQKEKEKYYGYFVAVTEYEKKIAQGVYNPDLDGVLKFD